MAVVSGCRTYTYNSANKYYNCTEGVHPTAETLIPIKVQNHLYNQQDWKDFQSLKAAKFWLKWISTLIRNLQPLQLEFTN